MDGSGGEHVVVLYLRGIGIWRKDITVGRTGDFVGDDLLHDKGPRAGIQAQGPCLMSMSADSVRVSVGGDDDKVDVEMHVDVGDLGFAKIPADGKGEKGILRD